MAIEERSLTDLDEWNALVGHGKEIGDVPIADLFKADSNRFKHFSLCEDGLLLDYSKNRMSPKTMSLLLALSRSLGLKNFIEAYQAQGNESESGSGLNWTEGRLVLHNLLRVPGEGGGPLLKAILRERARLRIVANQVGLGEVVGASGKRIEDVVHIGIGGSDLGPRLVMDALKDRIESKPPKRPEVHYASNIDERDLGEVLARLNPETTLFVVVSKSFTTRETLLNAGLARSWSSQFLGRKAATQHFYAVTANPKAASDFGVAEQNTFPFWDFVGGRTSVWSSVGLSVAMGLGYDAFEEFLSGAYGMDRHFFEAPLERNMPVVMALVGVWNRNVMGASSQAILPYAHGLRFFPAYLQQLEMESNGKSVGQSGEVVAHKTAPVIWGEVATPSQHSFFQWLHQGTDPVTVDFILVKKPSPYSSNPERHRELLSNGIAQSQALAWGSDEFVVQSILRRLGLGGEEAERLRPHLACKGNRPSTTLVMDSLSPRHLGQLMALYEHKVAVQGFLWGINSFDQFGVEIGKILSRHMMEEPSAPNRIDSDSSTDALIERCMR